MRQLTASLLISAFVAMVASTPSFADSDIRAPGPKGELHGDLITAGDGAPVVLIVPGSGPTDRDGNSPMGISARPYRLLADGLAQRGISSVRIDKRGMFQSQAAVPDANAVTIADYATDVQNWISAIREKTDVSCVWVLGHSEGALVALTAAQQPEDICGLVLVASPGRKAGDLLRAQLQANPANAPVLPQALYAINMLEKGGAVDPADLHPALAALFATEIQPFLRDLFRIDPAALMTDVTVPTLILQGESDLQVSLEDAQLLVAAKPDADIVLLPGVNHVLKQAPKNDMAANFATYGDPDLPLGPGVLDAIETFIKR